MPEVGGDPAESGQCTPDRECKRDDITAVTAVYPGGDGDTHGRVKQGERESRQGAKLEIRQAELHLDGLRKDGQHLPVHYGHHLHEQEKQQDVAAVALRESGCP